MVIFLTTLLNLSLHVDLAKINHNSVFFKIDAFAPLIRVKSVSSIFSAIPSESRRIAATRVKAEDINEVIVFIENERDHFFFSGYKERLSTPATLRAEFRSIHFG